MVEANQVVIFEIENRVRVTPQRERVRRDGCPSRSLTDDERAVTEAATRIASSFFSSFPT